MEGSDSGMI